MFKNIYNGKKVLITGNTGFKGTWLTTWFTKLNAQVVGISKDIPTDPAMFQELQSYLNIKHYYNDIRDLDKIVEIIQEEKPDFIFHLAAQPIVSLSYYDPIDTISSNVMGTANILEALRVLNHECVAVIITSDKAYDNIEQIWGYRENDKLGGRDIYSGSKGAAELILHSYFHSFFKSTQSKVRLGITRAGNVIGGGDWAKDRIVVDCVRAWSQFKKVEIRSPNATRPWQHVLEPLSGYLCLGAKLYEDGELHGEAFNFGPNAEQNHSVETLIRDLSKYWKFKDVKDAYAITGNIPFHEASLLKLNCDKALSYLKWQPTLDYEETVRFTGEWYYDYYVNKVDIVSKTLMQIEEYIKMARQRGRVWTE